MKPIAILFCLLAGTTAIHAQPPTITSFTPTSGSVGTLVTISGTNLSTPTTFSIGGVNAIVVSNTGTTLVGMVMPGAAIGMVSVSTTGGTANSSSNFTVTPTPFPSVQQGAKLVGTGAVGNASQGNSIAISADGNTAIVGGPRDNSNAGAAWVYTRSGGVWTRQGAKLVGTGAVGAAQQGTSVTISADGNTAIAGGDVDNSYTGAVWVYTRSAGVWTQQGAKLVGTGAIGNAQQGNSVSISSDGNTAIVGGSQDNLYKGAAWVYTRSGGVWTQQGAKLVGTGAVGKAVQGYSVAISSDGNTAITGGYNDKSGTGAAWVYTRSGGVWTQQGTKLLGTSAAGKAYQGISVSISSDGNTALVGGSFDYSKLGAAWVYTRSGGVWTQQGAKLVGTGTVGRGLQGASVSISSDGNTAIVGGYVDNNYKGAAWIYTRSGGVWTQQGTKLVGTGAVRSPRQGFSVSISSDGSTAMIGGLEDNNLKGAAWVFTSSSSVPVKLIAFTGERQGINNLLHWATATEQNNKGFELQRSAPSNSPQGGEPSPFVTIAFVHTKANNGNSTGELKYQYTDNNSSSTRADKSVCRGAFYRLNQIDNDGKGTLSNIVFIKGEMDNESLLLSLSPNPTSSAFALHVQSNSKDAIEITIYNNEGKKIQQLKTANLNNIMLGEKYSNGSYLFEVRQGNKRTTVVGVKQ